MIGQSNGSLEQARWDEVCQTYIQLIYQEIKTLTNYSIEETLAAMHKDVSLTYGEILYYGFEKLNQKFPMKASDVFVDCGSGLGKLLLQVFLSTEVSKVVGIEIEPTFAALSKKAMATVLAQCPAFFEGREMNVIESSFLTLEISDATVMFSCSTCFSEQMMYSMACWMNKHPNLRLVMSLKPIPFLEKLSFLSAERVECTWDSALCYVYG